MNETPKPKRTGWKVAGYILVVLTVLLALGAVRNLASPSPSDPAEYVGKLIGAIGLPVAIGFLARYCFRKSRG